MDDNPCPTVDPTATPAAVEAMPPSKPSTRLTVKFSPKCNVLPRKTLNDDKLTAHGQKMAELPAHPRIAHLLLRGQDLGLAATACDVAALLGERDILRGAGADLHSRLALMSGEERARGAQGGVQRAKQLARQYRSYL